MGDLMRLILTRRAGLGLELGHLRALLLAICGLGLLLHGAIAQAQDLLAVDDQEIRLKMTEAKILRLDRPAATVFLSDPGIAEIDLQTARYIYIVGKSVGRTSLFVLGEDEELLLSTTIAVGIDQQQLSRAVHHSVSGGNIAVSTIDGAIFLNGTVKTPEDLDAAEEVLAALTGPAAVIVNRLEVEQAAQVNLQVKIAEVSRSVGEDLGLSISRLNSGGAITPPNSGITNGFAINVAPSGLDVNFLLEALSQKDLVTILSEPNLTARSGETANFLAGGQIPFRVGDSEDDTRIELQPYGVELEFTPVVHERGRIEIQLKTRVREVDSSSTSTANSDIGPSLTERSASTTVDIGSGQSFAIAGMFQSSTEQALRGAPGLVNLPIIGALFRSSRYSSGETELVIVVTPYLVEPVNPRDIATPMDNFDPVENGAAQWLQGRFTKPLKPGHKRPTRIRATGGGFRLQ